MAHSKSAKKRIKTSERNRLKNKVAKSKIKTLIKKFKTLLEEKQLDKSTETLQTVRRELDKAVSKGILHSNTASRKKSRLTLLFNKFNPVNQTK